MSNTVMNLISGLVAFGFIGLVGLGFMAIMVNLMKD